MSFLLSLCILLLADEVTPSRVEPMLIDAVQLTFASEFHKAGESYFSDDGSRLIYQAVPSPPEGKEPGIHYGMYVSDVVRDSDGRVTGLENTRCITPAGSANTCGWFFPGRNDRVLFATTTSAPGEEDAPGYQRDSGDYRWQFPPEMNIVALDLSEADGTSRAFEPLVTDDKAYLAEGSISPDGRHLLYTSLASGDGDLWVADLQSGTNRALVEADGYDGGPFFSPDGRRITYRSDRRGDDYLQVFVADLTFDETGSIVGIDREYQVTNNEHVNWCPFWTRDGRALVYATSQVGHHNYEIFLVDADGGEVDRPVRYGTGRRRVTNAPGFDGLPAFTHDGGTMVWTSQRAGDSGSQLWCARFRIPERTLPGRSPAGSDDH